VDTESVSDQLHIV